MYAILWTYAVKAEERGRFERTYGPDGAWARLFARSEGYLGTDLFLDSDGSYLTIDRWHSQARFAAFLTAHRADYDALDSQSAGMTLEEKRLGAWESVAPV
jgi:heme-degrading monooxygenase HmoA